MTATISEQGWVVMPAELGRKHDLSFPKIRSGLKSLHLQDSVAGLPTHEWCAWLHLFQS